MQSLESSYRNTLTECTVCFFRTVDQLEINDVLITQRLMYQLIWVITFMLPKKLFSIFRPKKPMWHAYLIYIRLPDSDGTVSISKVSKISKISKICYLPIYLYGTLLRAGV